MVFEHKMPSLLWYCWLTLRMTFGLNKFHSKVLSTSDSSLPEFVHLANFVINDNNNSSSSTSSSSSNNNNNNTTATTTNKRHVGTTRYIRKMFCKAVVMWVCSDNRHSSIYGPNASRFTTAAAFTVAVTWCTGWAAEQPSFVSKWCVCLRRRLTDARYLVTTCGCQSKSIMKVHHWPCRLVTECSSCLIMSCELDEICIL